MFTLVLINEAAGKCKVTAYTTSLFPDDNASHISLQPFDVISDNFTEHSQGFYVRCIRMRVTFKFNWTHVEGKTEMRR